MLRCLISQPLCTLRIGRWSSFLSYKDVDAFLLFATVLHKLCGGVHILISRCCSTTNWKKTVLFPDFNDCLDWCITSRECQYKQGKSAHVRICIGILGWHLGRHSSFRCWRGCCWSQQGIDGLPNRWNDVVHIDNIGCQDNIPWSWVSPEESFSMSLAPYQLWAINVTHWR